MNTTTASTQLTDDETRRASQTLQQVPMIGLSGMPYAANVDDLLQHIERLGAELSKSLQSQEALRIRVNEHQHERHTVRKFLGAVTN